MLETKDTLKNSKYMSKRSKSPKSVYKPTRNIDQPNKKPNDVDLKVVNAYNALNDDQDSDSESKTDKLEELPQITNITETIHDVLDDGFQYKKDKRRAKSKQLPKIHVNETCVNAVVEKVDEEGLEEGMEEGLGEGLEEGTENDGWVVCETKPKKRTFKKNITTEPTNNLMNYSQDDTVDDYGDQYKLKSTWNVWVHKSESNNWTSESYKIIYKIDTLATFWKFYNNILKLDYIKYQFYIMRDNSYPTWEHETNRNGGTCSVRLAKDKVLDALEQLSLLILNESFNDQPVEINGISFGVKVNWGLIKIWNSNNNHDITGFIPSYMTKKFMASCRYRSVEPEY
jgi:hypothetical protein